MGIQTEDKESRYSLSEDFIYRGVKVPKLYQEIYNSLPTKFEDLYEIDFSDKNAKHGHFSDYYQIAPGIGGKILASRIETDYCDIGPIEGNMAFRTLRKEVATYKTSLELGIALPKNLEFVSAFHRGMKRHFPILVSDYWGDLPVDSLKIPIYQWKRAKMDFKKKASFASQFLKGTDKENNKEENLRVLFRTPDITYWNSRWNPKIKESVLIDVGRWEFRGVNNYS